MVTVDGSATPSTGSPASGQDRRITGFLGLGLEGRAELPHGLGVSLTATLDYSFTQRDYGAFDTYLIHESPLRFTTALSLLWGR